MKITKSQLRKIIKEEVSKVLLEEYTEEASLYDERHFLTLNQSNKEPDHLSFYDTFLKAIDPRLDGTPEQAKLLSKAWSIADAEQPSEVDEFDRLLRKVKLPADIVDRFKIKPKSGDMVHHVAPHTHFGTAGEKEEYNKKLAQRRASLLKKGKIQPPTKEKPWPT